MSCDYIHSEETMPHTIISGVQVMNFGLENIPPATAGLLALNTMLFYNPLELDTPHVSEGCVSAHHVLV